MRTRTVAASVMSALLVGAYALLATPGVPSAATGAGQTSDLNGNGPTYAAELRLTAAQQLTLEGEISAALQELPSARQITVNQIAWTEGEVQAILTFPIPGLVAPLAANCPPQMVCVYQDQDFGGVHADYFHCGNATIPSTLRVSSWHNNQTTNTASWLLSATGVSLQNTRALSKVSYVGTPSNDLARTIHVC